MVCLNPLTTFTAAAVVEVAEVAVDETVPFVRSFAPLTPASTSAAPRVFFM